MDYSRLSMPIGEAMFTQRSTRKFKPDPDPEGGPAADRRGGGQGAERRQPPGRPLPVVTDREKIREFARSTTRPGGPSGSTRRGGEAKADIPPEEKNYRSATELADTSADVPVRRLRARRGATARQLRDPRVPEPHAGGVGPRHRLDPDHAAPEGDGPLPRAVRIPKGTAFHFCIPMGYPAVKYGPSMRRPTAETTYVRPLGRSGPMGLIGKPAVSLAAVPGRRKATLEMAQKLRAGGLRRASTARAWATASGSARRWRSSTREIPFGTSIANIYTRHPSTSPRPRPSSTSCRAGGSASASA